MDLELEANEGLEKADEELFNAVFADNAPEAPHSQAPGESGVTSLGAPTGPRAQAAEGPRGRNVEEDHTVPWPGALRRYEPPGETPYWRAELGRGRVDAKGQATQSAKFREGFRTEAEAKALCEAWMYTTLAFYQYLGG